MTQLTRYPAYELIEDQLDAVGQKYRAIAIVRGVLLFVSVGLAASFVAALAAHLIGQSRWTWGVFGLWLAYAAASAFFWLIRPLLFSPGKVEVARLVESRIPGLHNGLTNSVLLAEASDLTASPWLPGIYEEIWKTASEKPLQAAFKLADLRPLVIRLALLVLPLLVALSFPGVRRMTQHGWRQMLHPSAFVANVGRVELVKIEPGNATLLAGQDLQISILARDPAGKSPSAAIFFKNYKSDLLELPPSAGDGGALRYACRLEHLEQPLQYRVEVGGTQSDWFNVNVVRQVKLERLAVTVSPPAYVGGELQHVSYKAEDLAKASLTAYEGSRIEVEAAVDVPVGGAMLQTSAQPQAMESARGQRFTGGFQIGQDTNLSILLTEAAGQVMAAVPDPPLPIRCTKDNPPGIEMKWPAQDVAVDPKAEIRISANLTDDHGLTAARILLAGEGAEFSPAHEQVLSGPSTAALEHILKVPAEMRRHGASIRIQVEATDNRQLPQPAGLDSAAEKQFGPQTASSPIIEIKFRDMQEVAKEQKDQTDKLQARLREMLELQRRLHTQSLGWKPKDAQSMQQIVQGQTTLRDDMKKTAETFSFTPETAIVQKTLLVLAANPAREAMDLSAVIGVEPVEKEQLRLNMELQSRQRRIIETLERLLAVLVTRPDPTTQPTTRSGGDLTADQIEQFKKLDEALKEFMKAEQRILDQTANLAKKPVDNYDDADKKLLEDLKLAQEKLDAFMQEKVSDFSKLAEQDMANASLLKELMEVYSEVTMAKDALKQKAAEIAVPLEESGLELAKEISSNLEKWLADTPDRQKWTMEEPVGKTDTPMAELPKELEDMVGELMEQQEDLFEEMEDASSQWADSLDKGAGWDAMDGPIANMSAKGVTGNTLPNNNEMNGRSGEGRQGKSSGEMVEETASGKGGRNTPTRLDPTPFQQGQVKDESKDPAGGATGGGKLSGQGGQGLEGPVPPKLQQEMKRLADKQAQLRNNAERLNLQYQLGRYDGFKLLESIAMMRRVESDLGANRYDNALRRKDILLDDMASSQMLLSGQVHVQQDSTPQGSRQTEEKLNDASNGRLPAAWKDALKDYYKKLATE